MFTGIVEEIGLVKSLRRQGGLLKLSIQADKILSDTKIGDSVAVNGACLTVILIKNKSLEFDVMKETYSITNLQFLKYNDSVNLERSLKVGDRLSGHFVLGHVDCLGILRRKTILAQNIILEIAFPSKFKQFLVKKGSISVEGISLTVVEVKSVSFTVSIIPYTWKNTNLPKHKIGDRLNLEFDILLKQTRGSSISMSSIWG